MLLPFELVRSRFCNNISWFVRELGEVIGEVARRLDLAQSEGANVGDGATTLDLLNLLPGVVIYPHPGILLD